MGYVRACVLSCVVMVLGAADAIRVPADHSEVLYLSNVQKTVLRTLRWDALDTLFKHDLLRVLEINRTKLLRSFVEHRDKVPDAIVFSAPAESWDDFGHWLSLISSIAWSDGLEDLPAEEMMPSRLAVQGFVRQALDGLRMPPARLVLSFDGPAVASVAVASLSLELGATMPPGTVMVHEGEVDVRLDIGQCIDLAGLEDVNLRFMLAQLGVLEHLDDPAALDLIARVRSVPLHFRVSRQADHLVIEFSPPRSVATKFRPEVMGGEKRIAWMEMDTARCIKVFADQLALEEQFAGTVFLKQVLERDANDVLGAYRSTIRTLEHDGTRNRLVCDLDGGIRLSEYLIAAPGTTSVASLGINRFVPSSCGSYLLEAERSFAEVIEGLVYQFEDRVAINEARAMLTGQDSMARMYSRINRFWFEDMQDLRDLLVNGLAEHFALGFVMVVDPEPSLVDRFKVRSQLAEGDPVEFVLHDIPVPQFGVAARSDDAAAVVAAVRTESVAAFGFDVWRSVEVPGAQGAVMLDMSALFDGTDGVSVDLTGACQFYIAWIDGYVLAATDRRMVAGLIAAGQADDQAVSVAPEDVQLGRITRQEMDALRQSVGNTFAALVDGEHVAIKGLGDARTNKQYFQAVVSGVRLVSDAVFLAGSVELRRFQVADGHRLELFVSPVETIAP
ncbi:MAG: hypothetical protein PF961_23375 [Planctomycetota bacterium]|jgi:hypothetical protein|nr:hypothetical protein [Planctomycetota bacterium]